MPPRARDWCETPTLRLALAAKRLHQVWGLSVFASAMSRFEDVKDYEESERIAAKVAASMTFQIKKGGGEQYGADLGGQPILQDGVPIRELPPTREQQQHALRLVEAAPA